MLFRETIRIVLKPFNAFVVQDFEIVTKYPFVKISHTPKREADVLPMPRAQFPDFLDQFVLVLVARHPIQKHLKLVEHLIVEMCKVPI